MGKFVDRTNVKVTVVFDGAADELCPEGSQWRGVTVCYSKFGSDADSRIVQLVEASPKGELVVVVTSDRELGCRVRSLGARIVSVARFLKKLNETDFERNDKPEYDGQLHAWLRYFGYEGPEAD